MKSRHARIRQLSHGMAFLVALSAAVPVHAQSSFARKQLPAGALSGRGEVVDINGDGKLDLFTHGIHGGKVGWYENISGRLSEYHVIANRGSYSALDGAVGDLDQDGDLDVVASIPMRWYAQTAPGQFSGPIPLSSQYRVARCADLDGDQWTDIIVDDEDNEQLLWLRNLGQGNFDAPRVVNSNMVNMYTAEVADLDLDGDMDVVTSSSGGGGRVRWHRNDGAGNFTPRLIQTGVGTQHLEIADFNGDGFPDVLAAHILPTPFGASRLLWWRNAGSDFAQGIDLLGDMIYPEHVETGDLDLDGDLDLLIPTVFTPTGNNTAFLWFENAGNGTVLMPGHIIDEELLPRIGCGAPSRTQAADWDQDGDLDFIGFAGSSCGDCAFQYENLLQCGQPFCSAASNSTGQVSTLTASGSQALSAAALHLRADAAPSGQPGLFYAGPGEVQVPFGNGVRCVGGQILRLGLPVPETQGEFRSTVDFGVFGLDLAGMTTTYFQCWYRDPAAGGASFNLSTGLSITWLP